MFITYNGKSDVRIISSADFTAAGLTSVTRTWNKANGFSIDLPPDIAAFCLAQGEFYAEDGSTFGNVIGGGGGSASAPLTLTSTATSMIPLTTKGASGQTANLLETKNNGNALLHSVNPVGQVNASAQAWAGDDITKPSFGFVGDPDTGWGQLSGVAEAGNMALISNGKYAMTIEVEGGSAESPPATIVFNSRATNRIAIQSGSSINFHTSSGHIEFESGDSAHRYEVNMNGYRLGTAQSSTIVFATDSSVAQACPLGVRMPATPTVNAFEVRNSADAVITRLTSAGNLEVPASVKLGTVTLSDLGGFVYSGTAGLWSNGDSRFGGYLQIAEVGVPAASADVARLFARDNGSGKTQLCVIFPTGAVQVLATEP